MSRPYLHNRPARVQRCGELLGPARTIRYLNCGIILKYVAINWHYFDRFDYICI